MICQLQHYHHILSFKLTSTHTEGEERQWVGVQDRGGGKQRNTMIDKKQLSIGAMNTSAKKQGDMEKAREENGISYLNKEGRGRFKTIALLKV